MRRVLLLPTVALLLLFSVGFLMSAGPFSPEAEAARPIVILVADDVKTLDVSKMSWANDIRMAMALWEGLAVYDMKNNLKPIPGAAKSWDISPDGLTYTFHLRPEAKWSNGDPVTADDFIFSWKRALTPVTGANYIGLFKSIEGAEEYTKSIDAALKVRAELEKADGIRNLSVLDVDDSKLGFKKLDNLTLQVQLKAPCTYFLDVLPLPVFYPLHRPSLAKFFKGPAEGYEPRWTLPGVVTNGPYELKEWIIKRSLAMERNPNYWDRENVKNQRLTVKTVSDSRSAFMWFESHDADLLTFIPAELKEDLYKDHMQHGKWPEVHPMPVFGTYYYVFNCARKPFDDLRLRRAMALAVDRETLVRMLNTGEKALGLIVPPDSINGYKNPPEIKQDVAEAKRLLSQAGYPDGKGLQAVELLYNTDVPFHGRIAQAVGQMWKANLGVDVKYRGLERGSFSNTRQQDHDFDVARGGWYGDYPDPTTWLDLFRSTDGNNDGKFSSKEYDALMAKSDTEGNAAARFELLKQAEQMLLDQAPFIPLYQYADGEMYDEHIEGVEMNVRNMTALKWIRRK